MLIRRRAFAQGSLFKIPIYRQLETHRLTYFPWRVTCLLDIWRCQCRDLFHVGGPTIYAGRKVLERIQRASSFPSSLLPFISAS